MMQTPPASTKETLRLIKILFYILFTGVVLSTTIVSILIQIQGPLLQDKSLNRGFFLVTLFVAAACLSISNILYKKRLNAAGTALPLLQKLEIDRAALILYMALCEAAAILTVIAFYMTGEVLFLVIIAAILVSMLMRRPENFKIFNELQLDSKEQMELS
jgi:hypothetical protein